MQRNLPEPCSLAAIPQAGRSPPGERGNCIWKSYFTCGLDDGVERRTKRNQRKNFDSPANASVTSQKRKTLGEENLIPICNSPTLVREENMPCAKSTSGSLNPSSPLRLHPLHPVDIAANGRIIVRRDEGLAADARHGVHSSRGSRGHDFSVGVRQPLGPDGPRRAATDSKALKLQGSRVENGRRSAL